MPLAEQQALKQGRIPLRHAREDLRGIPPEAELAQPFDMGPGRRRQKTLRNAQVGPRRILASPWSAAARRMGDVTGVACREEIARRQACIVVSGTDQPVEIDFVHGCFLALGTAIVDLEPDAGSAVAPGPEDQGQVTATDETVTIQIGILVACSPTTEDQ